METVIIHYSKTKMILGLIGAVAFVFLGFWIVLSDDFSTIAKIAGAVSILFFGLCGFIGIYKFILANENLIIDNKGITSNIVNAKFGTIRWKDIQGLDVVDISGTKLLLIFVENNEEYLEKMSKYQQKFSKANIALYNTPFILASTYLDCKFDYMKNIIISRIDHFNSKIDKNEY